MKNLTKEQLSFAVSRLKQFMESRDLNQSQLAQFSGVGQSTISKVISGQIEATKDVLIKLFDALGLRLNDILEEPEVDSGRIIGYLATPLTEVVDDPEKDAVIRRLVARIRDVLGEEEFQNPRFEVYWPGDHTHPRDHKEFQPGEVYLIDRSRVSSYDFLILFCGARSFGVGQENEIATQAALPAIRLVPENISRMLTGSFLNAVDIGFSGSLTTDIAFDEEEFRTAVHKLRTLHFQSRALYRDLNGGAFGDRLRELINDRMSDYQNFADELGVNLSYVHALMDEPLTVSNPSARLLKQMAQRLGVSVAYLLGEAPEFDGVWSESVATWRNWLHNKDEVSGSAALEIFDHWKAEYKRGKTEATLASYRKSIRPLSEADWERKYDKQISKAKKHGTLFS